MIFIELQFFPSKITLNLTVVKIVITKFANCCQKNNFLPEISCYYVVSHGNNLSTMKNLNISLTDGKDKKSKYICCFKATLVLTEVHF